MVLLLGCLEDFMVSLFHVYGFELGCRSLTRVTVFLPLLVKDANTILTIFMIHCQGGATWHHRHWPIAPDRRADMLPARPDRILRGGLLKTATPLWHWAGHLRRARSDAPYHPATANPFAYCHPHTRLSPQSKTIDEKIIGFRTGSPRLPSARHPARPRMGL